MDIEKRIGQRDACLYIKKGYILLEWVAIYLYDIGIDIEIESTCILSTLWIVVCCSLLNENIWWSVRSEFHLLNKLLSTSFIITYVWFFSSHCPFVTKSLLLKKRKTYRNTCYVSFIPSWIISDIQLRYYFTMSCCEHSK